MKIALINPNLAAIYGEYRHTNPSFPVGLAYVSAGLLKAGIEVVPIDADRMRLGVDEIADMVERSSCTHAAVSVTTPLWSQAAAICWAVKERNRDIKTIAGGPHITALGEDIRKYVGSTRIDSFFFGEAEIDLPIILKHHENLPKYAYCGEIDPDQAPFPDRRNFPPFRDTRLGTDITTMTTSRGCVGRCKYCVAGNRRGVRFHSLYYVAKELQSIADLGLPALNVEDDNFVIKRGRMFRICDVLRDCGFDYYIQAIPKFIDAKVAQHLARSGCKWACLGIESGDEAVLKEMGRLSYLNHVRTAVNLLREVGIKVRGSFMLGWVGETEKQMMKTLDLIRELKCDENAVAIVTPYPGTWLWDACRRKHPRVDFDNFCYYNKVGINLSGVPTERLLEIEREAFTIGAH